MITKQKDSKLKSYLFRNKLVEDDAMYGAEMESSVSDQSIGQILVRNGFLSQKDLIDALLEIVDDSLTDEEIILPHIPHEILIETQTKIIAQTVEKVFIASMSDEDVVIYNLSPYFKEQEICFVQANPDDIETYLDKLSTINDSESSVLESVLRNAIIKGASDIHIEPRRESYSVFYRVLGARRLIQEGALDEYLQLNARIKDRSKMDLAERRIPQDGGFSIEFNGRVVDLRVATAPMNEGEKITIRILDPEKANNKLTHLGIGNLQAWKDGSSRSDGLCLICGPTGSGKTTTMNASVRFLDRFEKAIYTAEDPVEYSIPYISQININEAVGLNFSRAVRAFMRADPDIIVIGEVRDLDTARNAIKAAETGHLVLATLHTATIHGAVDRLRDLGVESHELKYILRTVLAQRLMRVLCTTCYGENKLCSKCFGGGYSGRTIVSECHYFADVKAVNGLLNSEEVMWETMIEDAYKKYKQGMTTFEEMFRVFGAEARNIILEQGFSERDTLRIKNKTLDIDIYR
jgi:type II secretory ATPase GspE/PulE/Tfp pilus assembly ATPase PilB-like protein